MVIPSGVMDQRHPSPFSLSSDSSSSFFSEEIRFPERQVGFWKPESLPDKKGSESVFSSLEKLHSMGTNPMGGLETAGAYSSKDQKAKFSLKYDFMGQEKPLSLPSNHWGDANWNYGSQSEFSTKEMAFVGARNVDQRVADYENGLFSSSFSEMFNKNLKLTSDCTLGQSVDTNNSSYGEDEPLESIKEIEAQTIGNLLPDDDDLLSGVNFEYSGLPATRDDAEEDIFYTGGGMELETDDAIKGSKSFEGKINGKLSGGNPYGERPSRTLFVRNVNSAIEDSQLKALFQQYGDVHSLYTAGKHHGFVMVSYYDTRAAQNAMKALQDKLCGHQKLDINFSTLKDNTSENDTNQGTLVVCNLNPSVSNDELHRIFRVYGEIKEIHETTKNSNHRFVEFYDVRAAEAALCALNRSDVAGQKIVLRPSYPGGARQCSAEQYSLEMKQDGCSGCHQQPGISIPGHFGKISSRSLENGAGQGLYPSGPLMDGSFHETSSIIPQKATSPIRIGSMGQRNNQFFPVELSPTNFGHGMQVFDPQSLPEHQNGLPYNPNSIPTIGANARARFAEAVATRHLHKGGSGSLHGHSFDQNEAFGVSGIGSCPLHRHPYVWNSSNAIQHNPAVPMLWPNAASHPSVPIHGLPGVPSHLNTVHSLNQHHLGSAPGYGGHFAEVRAFHPGVLGDMGLPGSPQLYPSELSIFPHTGESPRESFFAVGFPSPHQRGPVHPARNMSSSHEAHSHTDRVRNKRHGSANPVDNKKPYELDLERLARGEDTRTTLMIKNIPNKYTCKMLLAVIDENHRGTYDFIYLPIDFKNKCNVGYAFINMADPQQIIPFYQTINGKRWEKFNSEKVATLAYARIQGKAALIAHFQNSSLMNEDKRCRPMLFQTDGPSAGEQEPFPVGSNVRMRSGKYRTVGMMADTVSPSTSPNRENSSTGTDSPSGSTKDPLE